MQPTEGKHATADARASSLSDDIIAHWDSHPGMLALLGVGFALLLLSRNPGVLLHAELVAEDAWCWYPDAYAVGLRSLLWPHGGYLHSIERLVGLAVQPS